MDINVKEAKDYQDGTGKKFPLEAGRQTVSDSLARRLVQENPDFIEIVGDSAPTQPADQGQGEAEESILS
jgi:hypothetical protein